MWVSLASNLQLAWFSSGWCVRHFVLLDLNIAIRPPNPVSHSGSPHIARISGAPWRKLAGVQAAEVGSGIFDL